VNIVFHAHATVNDGLQRRAEQAIEKLAARLPRTIDATVRFTEDGPVHRVEIELRAAPNRRLVAAASDRLYDLALARALDGLEAQVARERAARERRRRAAAERATGALGATGAPRVADVADGAGDLADVADDDGTIDLVAARERAAELARTRGALEA
jgi:ribosome-associated translation inhibitor RaiA